MDKPINTENKGYLLKTVITVIICLMFFPTVSGADDYLISAGYVGGQTINNNLIELEAGRLYFFTFKTTEPLDISRLTLHIYNYSAPPQFYDYNVTSTVSGDLHMVAHITFKVYIAPLNMPISSKNALVQIYEGTVSIINETDTGALYPPLFINPPQTYLKVHSDSIIGIGFTPSINIWVNGTSTAGTDFYEAPFPTEMIFELRDSLRDDINFFCRWDIVKGAISEDVLNPTAISVFNPSTILNAFATVTGFSVDAFGILTYTFILFSLTLFLYEKDIELSGIIFSLLSIGMVALFMLLDIVPYWFVLPIAFLCIGLIANDYGNKQNSGI